MKFAIARLIVWPRDEEKAARVVAFSDFGISLVTGSSRSGKSAIIKIIDYCLGSRSCDVPRLGPIRRSSAWYGIVVATDEGYKLLARRDPGDQDSTDDYMVVESPEPLIPARPVRNTNRASVKALLDRLARLPQANADFDDSGSGFKGRAAFGDLTSFIFQPQSVVANENVLFFEAEDEDHARKLREIFPLVLGAIDSETLVKQHRLAEIRRLLDRRRRTRDSLLQAVTDYAGEVRARYTTAAEMGLVRGNVRSLDDADTAVLVGRLKEVVGAWNAGRRPSAAGSGPPSDRLAALRHRESERRGELAALRLRSVQLRELQHAKSLSESVLLREKQRLSPVSWVRQTLADTNSCPICGSVPYAASHDLERLSDRVLAVERQWDGLGTVPPMLDAEEVEVRNGVVQLEEELRQLRSERALLEARASEPVALDEGRAVFVGELREFLRIQGLSAVDEGLNDQIVALEAEEQQLASQVDANAIARRREDALLVVSKYARHYAGIVELEDEEALISLDTRELTIRVVNEQGQSAWLHQIGSGANHLGYHIATMLALHEFFAARPVPHVPSLLVVDQPSQTQFPDDLDELSEQEELRAVHSAFEACASAIERTNGTLQIIVSEHAGRNVYEGVKHLTVVERWRRGRKLIPWHWDAEALEEMKGKAADSALEDLLPSVVLPAIASECQRRQEALLVGHRIRQAVFESDRLAFELVCELQSSAESPSESKRVERVVSGSISMQLVVEVGPIEP